MNLHTRVKIINGGLWEFQTGLYGAIIEIDEIDPHPQKYRIEYEWKGKTYKTWKRLNQLKQI